jgi:formamidopyrimidine-DNA glycosylase
MPEVVEVRKYSDFLRKTLHNNKIKNITILKGRYKKHSPFSGFQKVIKNLPLSVIDVRSKGKFIYFICNNDLVLFNTLGLSGGFRRDRNEYLELLASNIKNIYKCDITICVLVIRDYHLQVHLQI